MAHSYTNAYGILHDSLSFSGEASGIATVFKPDQ
jgi:hypothetical protein